MSLPKLAVLDPNAPPAFAPPTKRINETKDVSHFLTSLAYKDIGIFLLQLNRSVCPRHKPNSPVPTRFPLSPKLTVSPAVQALQAFLTAIEELITEAPPAPGPQRFGNVSFRTWHSLLEERLDTLLDQGPLTEILKIGDGTAAKEVKSYLLGGFGSSQRIDYGTGHELSFIAFLGCLWKLGYFKNDPQDGQIEREIVLGVVQPYLQLVRKLIMTYRLEPAGTHGVWGLDDHSFVPYMFGSAQLTRPINDTDPMPLEGSVRGAPKPGDITKPMVIEDERQTNMYFSAIGFINDIKNGPFWEHSPMLFDISGVKDGWGKINKGMIKMYNAEVLSKFPVVQHFWFGSLFSWDQDPDASAGTDAAAANPQSTPMPPPPVSGTAAPWAQSSRMPPPHSAGTTAPWAQQSRVPPGATAPTGTTIPSRVPIRPSGAPDNTGGTKAPWEKSE